MSIPRILIDITGGVAQAISADAPVELVIIDADDVDEYDMERVRRVNDEDAYIHVASVDMVDPEVLDPYFEAAKEINSK